MRKINTIVSLILLSTLTINTPCNAFITKWYKSYQMSGLTLDQQQKGFLLSDVQNHVEQIMNVASKRNQQELKNFLLHKKVTTFELPYLAGYCLDLLINHGKEARIVRDFDLLIKNFNHYVRIIPESENKINDEQLTQLKEAGNKIVQFALSNAVSASTAIKELQQKAVRENKPITSLLRKEIFIPLTLIAGVICYYLIWKKYIYKTPQERKIAERTRRSALDLQKNNHTCFICDEEKKEEELEVLSCGHKYCTQDLTTMIDLALKAKSSATLVCPDPKCKRSFTKDDVAYISMYNNQTTNAFLTIQEKERISRNPNGRNCPTKDCPYMFVNKPESPHVINCPECKNTYCSNCLGQHRRGIRCGTAQLAEDSETAQWQREHTKPCPECNMRIEKNDGCDHMTCANCRYEFCWECLAQYLRPHRDTCSYNDNFAGNRAYNPLNNFFY